LPPTPFEQHCAKIKFFIQDFIMGNTLKPQLSDAVKAAMRAKDAARLATLRFLLAAIQQKEVDERRELDDAEVTTIIEKQVKQRRESIAAFEHAGRTETADHEKAELIVLQEFLPMAATEEEVEATITAAIENVKDQGITGGPAMGKIMALVKAALAGRADMSAVSAQVKARLM
jgi:uncharacterized protein YqeY